MLPFYCGGKDKKTNDNLGGIMVDGQQIKLLSKMKKLINEGHRKFACRKDRDYIAELLEIGISESEAWNQMLSLSIYNYCQDYMPSYRKNGEALVFKKIINGYPVYIKLKLEECDSHNMTVCLSFHIDHK